MRLKKQQNMSENPDMIPVFQDEVHFQAQTSITRAWAPKGSEPKVMSKPGKNNIAYSGFVIPATGELYVTKPGWFNYESVIQSFRDFIQSNPVPEGKKYCMILDNGLGIRKRYVSYGKRQGMNMLISEMRWNIYHFRLILQTLTLLSRFGVKPAVRRLITDTLQACQF